MDTRLDIERAYTFIFKDPKWFEKIAVAAFLTLTFIGSPAVYGWVMEIQKRVQDGSEDDTLPEWKDLGEYFIDGLKLMVINFIWFLPFTLLYFVIMIPFYILPLFPVLAEEAEGIVVVFTMLGAFLPFMLMPFIMVTSFLMYAILPLIAGSYLENREFSEGFNFKRVFALLKANFWILLAASFLGYIASYFLSMVGMVLCFIGIFLISPIAMAIMFHFFGQAYRISKIKLEAKNAAEEPA
ncbi:MAG TPA: DUF4013 domain-containing protein [Anaerolineales bacterium]|nr:DUF4013 domain-containing protein [Anaerolineales bacterium]